jgi:hypothetical protein
VYGGLKEINCVDHIDRNKIKLVLSYINEVQDYSVVQLMLLSSHYIILSNSEQKSKCPVKFQSLLVFMNVPNGIF